MPEELCLEPINGNQRCLLLRDHVVPCSPDPDGGWITIPNVPFSEIQPRLWQGGSYYYEPSDLKRFSAILTVNGRADPAPTSCNERRFYMTDGNDLPDMKRLVENVDWVYSQWRGTRDAEVLVRCQAGLNRSGLVIALVLYKFGVDINDAINLIRVKRSPYALCNSVFVDYLRSLI